MQGETAAIPIVSNAAVQAALDAFNAFPCPNPGSIARSWNAEQMRAALEAALGCHDSAEGASLRNGDRTAKALTDRILALYVPTTKALVLGRHGLGVVNGGAFREFTNGCAQSQVAMFTGAEHFAEGERDANAAFYAGIHTLVPEIIQALQSGAAVVAGPRYPRNGGSMKTPAPGLTGGVSPMNGPAWQRTACSTCAISPRASEQ